MRVHRGPRGAVSLLSVKQAAVAICCVVLCKRTSAVSISDDVFKARTRSGHVSQRL